MSQNQHNEIKQIINQAKSEARFEKITKFLSKNSKVIISLVVVITTILVSYFVFKIYQKSQQEKYSEILQISIIDEQKGELEKAKESLKEIVDNKSVPSGVRSIASLRYAAFLYNEGKKSEALEIYKNLNDCSSCDPYIKDLSGLLMIKIWIADDSEVQKSDLADRIAKIEKNSSELKYEIIEQKAIFELQQNNLQQAYDSFNSIINNPEVSKNLQARAKEGLAMISSKGFDPLQK